MDLRSLEKRGLMTAVQRWSQTFSRTAQREGESTVANEEFQLEVSVAKHWKRLPTEAVESPSLEIFKTLLNTALSHMIHLWS